MTKVRFTRSVSLEGIDYPLGSVQDVPAKDLKALSRSVELLEPVQTEKEAAPKKEDVEEVVETPEAEQHDVTVEAPLLKLNPDKKAVEAPKVDKMLKKAPKKK